jgi:hypothetical protein
MNSIPGFSADSALYKSSRYESVGLTGAADITPQLPIDWDSKRALKAAFCAGIAAVPAAAGAAAAAAAGPAGVFMGGAAGLALGLKIGNGFGCNSPEGPYLYR